MTDPGWVQLYFIGPFGWVFVGPFENLTAATAFAAKHAPLGIWAIPR